MHKRYVIVALPALATIAIGWIMPLVMYGHIALVSDGGGRVVDDNGVCCMEPTPYYIARMAALLSPFVVAISSVVILNMRSKVRKQGG